MKNKNTQSGITLIALVVTIVVLLILAGITIAFVLSDGGIFQSAKDAKIEQTAAAIRDYVGQINGVVSAKYWSNVANGDDTPITLRDDWGSISDTDFGLMEIFGESGYGTAGLMSTLEEPQYPITCDENGMIKNVSFVVIANDEEYDVKFDGNGIATVSYVGIYDHRFDN